MRGVILSVVSLSLLISQGTAFAQESENSDQAFKCVTKNDSTDSRNGIDSKIVSTSYSIQPGPLEIERAALLKNIKQAKDRGIGIQAYMAAFDNVEDMVLKHAPEAVLQERLTKVKEALEDQTREVQAKKSEFSKNSIELNTKPANKEVHGKLLPLESARLYMLALVNKDRSKHHLSALSIDSVATAAAQQHAEEMARVGYTGHLDTLGRKPFQRYNDAGGVHTVGENCWSLFQFSRSGKTTKGILSEKHLFSSVDLERMEDDFMKEKPPFDGHRLQILDPQHSHLGVGLAFASNGNYEWRLTLAQEFVNKFGEYSKIPAEISRGKPFSISGHLAPGLKLYSVRIFWETEPAPLTRETMPESFDYPYNADIDFFVNQRPKELKIWTEKGSEHFTVTVLPADSWKSGLYYVEITATHLKSDPFGVSDRVIHLR